MIVMKSVTAVAVRAVAAPAVTFLARKDLMMAGTSPASTAFASIAHTALALRGGAEVMDLTRVRIRLEGLSAYGVVSSLMLNAALRLYSSSPKKLQKGETCANIAKILFAISVGSSVLAGAYTTVVFSLLGLYAKSAIGMGKDAACMEFMTGTEHMRLYAFDAFLVALIAFKSSFVLSLFLNYEGKLRWWASGIAAAVSLLSWYHWSTIMVIARNLLFS
jgi:hypothetical protein